MHSDAHVRQTGENLLGTLVLLHVLAEGAVPQFHVSELILILNEEATAMFTHGNGHLGDHVLEVAPR